MTKPFDDSEFAAELHELLVAAALGDATDAQVARLNNLLLHDERLRHPAARFFEEEAVLRREFNVLDRVVEFHKTLGKAPVSQAGPLNDAGIGCESRILTARWQRLALAVTVLLSISAGFIWLAGHSGKPSINQAGDGSRTLPPPATQSVKVPAPQQGVPPIVANILTPVIHVSWSGPQFASDQNARPPASTIRNGITTFTSTFGWLAQGYMVSLEPGALLDLIVAGDAEGENALAVIEFDGSGRPTGRRISFNNSAGNVASNTNVAGKLSTMTKKGRLGIWTERNDSSTPRYFLFTGVHKLLNRSADDSWHVSDLSVFVEEPGLMHIGWDDSGMPSAGDQDLVQFPDYDFDDVTATIRIRKSGPESDRREPSLHIYSKTATHHVDSNTPSRSEPDEYPFSVAPGQSAIVKVCSRSGAPVEVAVFEKGSDARQWYCQKGKSQSPTLGICAIENDTAQSREFYVVGQRTDLTQNSHSPSHPLSHTVLSKQEEFVTVGFGDDDQLASDFYKVRVDILTLNELGENEVSQ